MSLRKIGTVSHVASDGRIVARLTFIPPLGIQVFDYGMKRVGALYDVIGPVKAPYGLIKTSRADPNEVVGKPIYVTAKDLEKRASRENRRERRGGRREAGRGN
ncbi:H/ACA RNA-protein complex protein Gar1 [Thermocladium modestius]|uniref:H/ACA RNA-protein complex protein Gar1 n=1 Tax=Thermocladium modestius TaxID=62609 RepID=A0A830GVV9_9CREN|nr:Gar1/Naf1 family protein [Thermocladium modestius]GGP22320.1 H/ACA RNA-protein complex protein Gar1 [Thermocladium modestius]